MILAAAVFGGVGAVLLMGERQDVYAALGALLGALMAVLGLVHGRLKRRWGWVTAWALLSLVGAASMLVFLPFASECVDARGCAREGAVLALLGVLLVAVASLFPFAVAASLAGWSLAGRVRSAAKDVVGRGYRLPAGGYPRRRRRSGSVVPSRPASSAGSARSRRRRLRRRR